MLKRNKGAIEGIVQGVGFRPFVYKLAQRYGLSGYVTNTPTGVILEVEGEDSNITRFRNALMSCPPPLAYISSADWQEIPPKKEQGFQIIKSQVGQERSTLISPDVCICEDCLREMFDPRDRRYRYPFINCTNCGPRYTIIQDIPYDRATTTMKVFRMCPSCQKEYEDPSDRRFHAQPNACWDCGPQVSLYDSSGKQIICHDPVRETISLLERGYILAIKGLGGFHLAVDAANHKAVVRLRRRKHREEKPLAIMVKDLNTAATFAHISEREAAILTSIQRPIVLLRKRRSHGLSPQIAPRNRYFGIMLPYTPLHYLLMEGKYKALVLTSGNMTEEPINIDNHAAFENLGDIADFFLVHNRDIYLRSDDSVVRVVAGVPRQIRRSRGYVPVPIFLSQKTPAPAPTLAVGAELKNTVCLTKDNRAFLSQHIGDMENLETYQFFELTITHLQKILEIDPEVVACDLHPDYLSTRFAKAQNKYPVITVQHHHAHIVSCMAEHGLSGPVIGLAIDGTGMGEDGKIWGCEFLVANLTSYTRIGHLDYIPQPGGDMAAKQPWRMALIYLYRSFGDELFDLPIPFVSRLKRRDAEIVLRMALKGMNSPLTSSCGRLFDAVASLIGLRDTIAYEGQAAIELEMTQAKGDCGAYPTTIRIEKGMRILVVTELIRSVVKDIMDGVSARVISSRFHRSLIGIFASIASDIGRETGLLDVVLSGGSFQNATLLSGLHEALEAKGFTVYSHRLVPTNDGGLSLGQAVCAGLKAVGRKGDFL
ncbi:MAG: carbamoyltransferase HypF [Deltaproteobacteria bacterium]|nr:MAG: carbamoyltransferase HypF [Deltaproteobacteria bacterium]